MSGVQTQPAVLLHPAWWAGGLTLAERCALSGLPSATEDAERLARAGRRIDRWRQAHRLGHSGQFGRRLDEAGLDETVLAALLAEERTGLAARAVEPAWADHVRAVLDGSASWPKLPLGESLPWEAGFAAVAAPFVRPAVDRFVAEATRLDDLLDVDTLRGAYGGRLAGSLVTVAGRTLVLELNVLRVTDRLAGETPDERFWSFVRQVRTPQGLADLFDEYPVLARLLAQTAEQSLATYVELLERFAADRAGIVDTVLHGVDPGRLVEVSFGGGDQHHRGRSVALLRLASGARLVYKPRPLAVHVHFNQLVGWLNDLVPDLGLRTLTVLDRDEYGWVEFVEHRPCASRGDVERYYHRQGALLALLYALDASDFHFENLIAGGDQPVLVDLETLFHPAVGTPAVMAALADDPAWVALRGSVNRIGLLPAVIWNEDGAALDLGGLGGDAGNPLPFKTPTWEAPGTDEMRLIRTNPTFPGSQNRPRIDEVTVDPGDFTGHLLTGFDVAYDAICAYREDLVTDGGLLSLFAGDRIRVVPRATRTYASLLMESTHPDVLRDALDRDQVLDYLWALSVDDPVREVLVPFELADLWRGDVPFFSTQPGSRDLWTSEGTRLPDLLEVSGLDRAVAKIREMGPRDRRTQDWIIGATLATRSPGSALGTEPDTAPATRAGAETGAVAGADPQRLLDAARRIADRLADTAHLDGDRASWLGLDLVDESRWIVQPLRFDLYGGYPGVALFLGQLARITGIERYADLARAAFAPVPRVLDALADLANAEPADPDTAGAEPVRLSCGPFGGPVGLAYVMVHLNDLLGDAETTMGRVTSIIETVPAWIGGDENLDIIGGSAGCIAAMLAIHDATGLDGAMHVARRCADHLIDRAEPQQTGVAWSSAMGASQPLTGFSHGASGIGWALLAFAGVTGEQRYAATALDGFAYERSLLRPELGNWPDFRMLATGPFQRKELSGSLHAWCHGSPGIGLARAASLRWTDDPEVADDLDRATAAMLGAGPLSNHSLCHGEVGNLELLTAAIATGRTDLVAERDRRIASVVNGIDRTGPLCGTPGGVPTPGLMSGLAGVGHGLLRLAFPDRVPPALLLAAPVRERSEPRSLERKPTP